jgi:hypothetical protein
MKHKILNSYANPAIKACFYTGQNHPKTARALGVKSWDWTPQKSINVEPWYWNTHTLALAFGCKQKFTSEGNEWIEDMITDPEQVKDVKIPNVWDGRTGEILREMKSLFNKHPEDTLIRLPDIQSPLGVAELMWDQSFYIALIMNPAEIHVLLDKITSFAISYIKEIKKVLGVRYNPATHPHIWSSTEGYYISDDVNSMIPPDLHMEYSINYINRITIELGPVHYHSCTWTDIYYDNIEKLQNVKAVNWSFGTSSDPAELIHRFSGKFFLTPHLGLDTHLENGITTLKKNINSAYDLTKYLLDNMQDNTSLYIVFQEDLCEDREQMKRIVMLLDDYGYSPPDIQ